MAHRAFSKYAKIINESAVVLIARTFEDLIYIRNIKYALLEAAELPAPVIDEIKKKDILELNNWVTQVMGYFSNSYPSAYLSTVNFEKWKEVLRVEEKEI